MTLFNPQFVDGCVLDRYLSRLADNTAQLTSRLEALEQRLDQIHTKAQEMQKAVERLESGIVINQIVRDKTRVENII